MKRISSLTKSHHAGSGIIIMLVLCGFAPLADAQQTGNKPVADIRQVMDEHSLIASGSLWPEFNIKNIPVAVYDSVNTWLFFSDKAPEGFRKADENIDAFIFEGQHPLVRGNSVTRFGDQPVATSILSNYSRRTGEKYSPKDMAGIIVHEQFHIFLRARHASWRQNDGMLLFYPGETREALFLRRIEKEAFKRAVLAGNKKEMAGWAATAIDRRNERLAMIPAPFGNYENELQRTEGLSDYIERKARGLDPLNASNMTNGIAPAGVRDLGYWEGRWIAMISDRLNNEWKTNLEANDTLYLDEMLASLVNDLHYKKKSFSTRETDLIKADAERDFDEWQTKKSKEIETYRTLPGYSLEINSSSSPFNIRIFEPLEIETLPGLAVFHRKIFSAANEKGSMRILNHPCITGFDGSFRLFKIEICGLKEAPRVIPEEKKLVLKYDDISLEVVYSELKVEGDSYSVSL